MGTLIYTHTLSTNTPVTLKKERMGRLMHPLLREEFHTLQTNKNYIISFLEIRKFVLN